MRARVLAMGVGMLGLVAGAAHASPPPRGTPREPPPFAFEACNGKSEGDDCSVSFHDEAHAGSCLAYADQRLFCLPEDMPPPPDGPPPGDRPGQ